MKARLVRVGNSRGVRIPKALIQETGLGEDVELRARGRSIVISPGGRPRAGWREAARQMKEDGPTGLLDPPSITRFDRDEWEW